MITILSILNRKKSKLLPNIKRMINNSRRSIFPEMDNQRRKEWHEIVHPQSNNNLDTSYSPISTRLFQTLHQLDSSYSTTKFQSIPRDQTLSVEQLEMALRQIEEEYYQGKLDSVKTSCKMYLNRLRSKDEQRYVKMYINCMKRWLGMTYLKDFQTNSNIEYLKQAKKYFKYYQPGESAHKRAKRLNNLGLCQLFLNQNANSFQYFSKALQIYQEDKGLSLFGLLKNISQLYRGWEMYDEAITIYKQMLEVSSQSRNGLPESEEQNIIVLMLQCSNLCQNEPNRKLYFYRARDLIKKMKETEANLYINLKLRFQVVNYSVKWGISEGDCSIDYLDDLIKNVQAYQPKQPNLLFLQASCFYIYRELFAGRDWKIYKQLSECADKLFHKIQRC